MNSLSSKNDCTLAFLIPLKPKAKVSDWQLISHLLRNTCLSLKNQSNQCFVAIIAGHDRPLGLEKVIDEKIHFTKVNYGIEVSEEKPRRDKFWKVCFAGTEAEKFNPKFHMILDADDLVHKNLVQEVASKSDFQSIILNHGWEFDLKLKLALKRKNLHLRCGSTFILRSDTFPLPIEHNWKEWSKMPHLKTPHQDMETWMLKNKINFCYSDLPAILYIKGHGYNLSDAFAANHIKRWFGFHTFGRPINEEIYNIYGISPTSFIQN